MDHVKESLNSFRVIRVFRGDLMFEKERWDCCLRKRVSDSERDRWLSFFLRALAESKSLCEI